MYIYKKNNVFILSWHYLYSPIFNVVMVLESNNDIIFSIMGLPFYLIFFFPNSKLFIILFRNTKGA
jgi:hypothetical protein